MDVLHVRREGMAEAVVRVVLSRRAPMISGEVWCDLLGLTHQDIRDAMQRLKVNPTTPLVRDAAPAPPEVVSVTRRKMRRQRRDGSVDGRHLNHAPRNSMAECEFCGEAVMRGKRMMSHKAAHHPNEWAAAITADILAEYADMACPDCGAPITVKVTVEVEQSCSCHHEPSYYCARGDCQQDVPLSQVEAHQLEHIQALAAAS